MEQRYNKPRVFLSHARTDEKFIERLQEDFRKCQIESWRDQTDIRDGQPWLEAIFENGIPICDAILAYFTPDSLKSKMVAKEVDAGILRKLKDNTIAFLPYVSENTVRDGLRIDIQSLHCRSWNAENYAEILPSVVGEVWRSYLDRTVSLAVASEHTRRLELQLEVEKLSKRLRGNIFSVREENEFEYIFTQLNQFFILKVSAFEKGSYFRKRTGDWFFHVSFLNLLLRDRNLNHRHLDMTDFFASEFSKYKKSVSFERKDDCEVGAFKLDIDPFDLLSKFGLIEITGNSYNRHFYKPKMSRFVYWCEYRKLEPKSPLFEFKEFIVEEHT